MTPYLLNQLLEASAQADPGAVAVVDRERRMGYGELESTANRLARLLSTATSASPAASSR